MAEELHQAVASADEAAAGKLPTARFDRADWYSFAVTTTLLLAVYLFTLAPEVTLDYSGFLSAGAIYGGVVHPPGYPLWTIYSWCFTKLLPFSTIAWRVAAGSAVASALACGIIALIVSRGGGILMRGSSGFAHLTSQQKVWLRLVCGYVAGMALGLSGTVWRKAVIVDIWALSLLLFSLIVCCALRWMSEPQRKRFIYTAFFLLGLVLTSSQEMIVTLPALICVTMLGSRKLGRDLAFTILPLAVVATGSNQFGFWLDFFHVWNRPMFFAFLAVTILGLALVMNTRGFGSQWKAAMFSCALFLLGLSFYLYLPVASMTNPPMNWGYPRTVEGFFHVLTRGQYEKAFPTDDLGRYLEQLWLFFKMIGTELGWPYFFLLAIPPCLFLRMNRVTRKWLIALVALMVCVGFVLVAEMNLSPDRQSQELLTFYFMPAFAVLSIMAGLGLTFLGGILTKPVKRLVNKIPRLLPHFTSATVAR